MKGRHKLIRNVFHFQRAMGPKQCLFMLGTGTVLPGSSSPRGGESLDILGKVFSKVTVSSCGYQGQGSGEPHLSWALPTPSQELTGMPLPSGHFDTLGNHHISDSSWKDRIWW